MRRKITSILLFFTICINAQEIIEKPDFVKKSVKYNGQISLSDQYYSASNITKRRPDNVIRLNYNAKLKVGRYFEMPTNIMMSSLPVHYGSFEDQKGLGDFTSKDFYQNPANTVQTGIYYKSFKLDLGTISVRYSDLTMGGLPMFGAGIIWNPSVFILQGNYGVAAHAIEQDTANSVAGQYKRDIRSLKFGLGKLDKNYFCVNIIQGIDDISSVSSIDSSISAQSGIVLGIDFLATLNSHIKWKGEIAGSIFTSNQQAEQLPVDEIGISQLATLHNYFPLTFSSYGDFAAMMEIMQNYENWSLGLKGEYIGAGYTSMGQPFLQNDKIDITASPNLRLLKSKLNINLNGGYRINNLSGTTSSTMNQILMSANIGYQVNKHLSIATGYSNFGIQNDVVGDTLRIRNVTQSYSLIPTYVWTDKGGTNTFNLSAIMSDFQDFNVVSGALNSNASLVYSGGFNRQFNKLPFKVGLSGSKFDMSSTLYEVHTTNANLNLGYAFFKKTLSFDLTTTYSINRANAPDSDNQLSFRLAVSYTSPFKMVINLSASNNEYNYAATSGLGFYRENLLNLGISQKF